MMTIALRFGVGALFAGTALACSSDSSTSPRRPVATIEITAPQELEVNQPGTATAVVKDADGVRIDDGAVTWSSSFTPVAAIQPQTGEIFALRGGQTQITATVDGKTATKMLVRGGVRSVPMEVRPGRYVVRSLSGRRRTVREHLYTNTQSSQFLQLMKVQSTSSNYD